jgi:hypothetical protein
VRKAGNPATEEAGQRNPGNGDTGPPRPQPGYGLIHAATALAPTEGFLGDAEFDRFPLRLTPPSSEGCALIQVLWDGSTSLI